jgi:heat shock protein HslJ
LDFTDDDRLVAHAGCNTMSGSVRLTDGRLRADELAITDMACEPEMMAADAWMSDLLLAEPEWELRDDGTLVLTADEHVVTLVERGGG